MLAEVCEVAGAVDQTRDVLHHASQLRLNEKVYLYKGFFLVYGWDGLSLAYKYGCWGRMFGRGLSYSQRHGSVTAQ